MATTPELGGSLLEGIKFNDFDPEEYLKQCTKIDDTQLDNEFIELPSALAFWSAQYAEAIRDQMTAKHNLESVSAKLHLVTKAEAEFTKKKLTVADTESKVRESPEYTDAMLLLIEAEARKARLKGCLEAVHAKKDMLQSLGAKLRAEMGADPMVRNGQVQKPF